MDQQTPNPNTSSLHEDVREIRSSLYEIKDICTRQSEAIKNLDTKVDDHGERLKQAEIPMKYIKWSFKLLSGCSVVVGLVYTFARLFGTF